jgi:hypothetical protein
VCYTLSKAFIYKYCNHYAAFKSSSKMGNENLEITGIGKEYIRRGGRRKVDTGMIWIKERNNVSKGRNSR